MRPTHARRSLLATLVAVALLNGCGSGDDRSPEGQASMEEPRPTASGAGTILRLDPRFDALVPPGALIEQVAGGFGFVEGPVWITEDSSLLFSDLRDNAIRRWSEADSAQIYIQPFYDGSLEGRPVLIGPNGLTRDGDGRIVAADHGRRQVTRIEADGSFTALADHYEGARLNSPDDVVYRGDGWLYFTDPTYGLLGGDDSPDRELDFNGVYRLSPDGELELLTPDQSMPNGIAFSPDQNTLYVSNSDPEQTLWMAYDVGADGLTSARVFLDATGVEGPGTADSMKLDDQGNLFATGPGGVWVIAPDGTHLGTITPSEVAANVAWGEDGRTLYITARTGLYRIRVTTSGPIP